jgi:hypothetical protein
MFDGRNILGQKRICTSSSGGNEETGLGLPVCQAFFFEAMLNTAAVPEFWTVTDADDNPKVIVRASTADAAKFRVKCLGLWRSELRVRETVNHEYRALVHEILAAGGRRRNLYWFTSPYPKPKKGWFEF